MGPFASLICLYYDERRGMAVIVWVQAESRWRAVTRTVGNSYSTLMPSRMLVCNEHSMTAHHS
jgi:hypothetical protein